MKNKFLIIMLAVMMGIANVGLADSGGGSASRTGGAGRSTGSTSTSNIDVQKVDYIDWEIIEDKCIGCGVPEGISNIPVNVLDIPIDVDGSFTCTECGSKVSGKGKVKLNGAYANENLVVNVTASITHDYTYDSFGGATEVHKCRVNESVDIDLTNYGFVRHDCGYYIYKDLFDHISIDASDRVLFSASPEGLQVIHFNPLTIELYIEGECGSIISNNMITKKYGIVPLYEDVEFNSVGFASSAIDKRISGYDSTADHIVSGEAFLVCENDKKCRGDGCSNLVASNGWTNDATAEDLCLSKGCAQYHACGFFWEINNGGPGYNGEEIESIEGIDCREIKEDITLDFCKAHTCLEEGCNTAIIGVNLMDARVTNASPYKGKDSGQYSNFCVKHFCYEYLCANARISDDSSTHDTNGKYKIHFPNYCELHCDDCGIAGCSNPVSIAAYEKNGGRNICTSCGGEDGENIGFAELAAEKYKCCICNTMVLEQYGRTVSVGFFDKFICQDCLREMYNDKESDKWDELKNIDNSTAGATWEDISASIVDNDGENDNPVNSNGEFVGFEGNEVVRNQYKYCNTCKEDTLHTKNDEGIEICIKCGRDENGKSYEIYEEPEYDYGEWNGGDYSGDDWNFGGDYNSDINTPIDSTQCIHSNYPVPNTVKFSNITATTHVQTWTCINCNGEQMATYEHTYINGICVCGQEEDSESPTIELISPKNFEITESDTDIRVKITDDRELKSIKYKCFWGENTDTVTKEISGKIQELLIGTLPTEPGTYTLFIQEVVDAAGNKLEDQTYIFKIKNTSDAEEENNKPIDESDKEKPQIKLGVSTQIDTDIKENTTVRVNLNDSKVTLLLSDNKALKSITYNCLWEEDIKFKTEELSGTMDTVSIENIPQDKDAILVISDLTDEAGNEMEKVIIIFEATEEIEEDLEKPKIELVAPKSLSEVSVGTKIKIKFSDNKGLNNVNYTVSIKESGAEGEIKREETREFNGALSQDLEIATLENNSSIVVLELKAIDKAGNDANAKYTFKMASTGIVEVEGEGDAGYFEDDSEHNTENNDVEYEDSTSANPV